MPVAETLEDTISRMLIAGSRLAEIEAFIECQPIADEQKSALWLWAWAAEPRMRRHSRRDLDAEPPRM